MDVLVTCKYEEDPIKNEGARVDTTFSPLLHYGTYPLPWTSEFCSDLAQNLMQPSPHPNDVSDKISIRLAHWLRRFFEFENVYGRTPDQLVYYMLTL